MFKPLSYKLSPFLLSLLVITASCTPKPDAPLENAVRVDELREFSGESEAYSLVFSPDGQTLAVGSGDSSIKLWQISDEALMRTIQAQNDEGPLHWVYSLLFSPDGQTLAGGLAGTRAVNIWRVSDGALQRSLEVSLPVAFTPDWQILAGTTEDDNPQDSFFKPSIKLLRLSDGALLHTLVFGGGRRF